MSDPKGPMIDKENRPTPLDFKARIADWTVGDLVAVVQAQIYPELLKVEKEHVKPELLKSEKEISKVEKEVAKLEKEGRKVEKEILKGEKEILKTEKEFSKPELTKPEKEVQFGDLVERIATRVVEVLKEQGIGK